jgi:hypothetical protein
MYRTDVAGYYPSVDIERLRSLLQKCGCQGPANTLILRIFRDWQLRDGLQGLPIGPEVSAVLGNFLLGPVDGWLEASGYPHLRWSDDILTFGQTIASCQGSIAVIDEVLSDLRLTRSADKTLSFDNVLDARRNLQDHLLMSLTDLLSRDDDTGTDAVRSAYDSQILGNPEVQQNHFRWVIKTLLNRHDSYGCLSLARKPSLMNIDPQLSGKYLGKAGLENTHVVNAMMDRLSKPAEDLFDGLDLHLLAAIRHRRLGDAEAKEFRSIATDSTRRWPVRVYGWSAYVGATQRYPELMEAARAETIPQLRRGMIANLRGRARQTFLNHARVNFPESRYTIQWLQAA